MNTLPATRRVVRACTTIRAGQRGAISIVGMIWLSVALVSLMAIDIGHVFWQQREVQRIADMAALAGAGVTSSASCQTSAQQNASANGLRPSEGTDTQVIQCGNWNPQLGSSDSTSVPPQYFRAGLAPFNAARVTVTRRVPYLFVINANSAGRTVTATATAARSLPRAALNIRSTLAEVDTAQSAVLNAVFGRLLGGNVSLNLVGWDGLAKTNINLLTYLDALAVRLNVGAGRYDELLNTETSVGILLQAAIDAMTRGGNAVDGAINVLEGLINISPTISQVAVKLGDLLGIQSGTPASGLNLDLGALTLTQGIVQLANKNNAAAADIPLDVLGLATVTIKLKVIEPPQISAVGDPELAKADPTGPNQIYVRTAQVRSLISVDFNTALGTVVPQLLNAVTDLLLPVTNLLNNVLKLDLVAILEDLSCLLYCNKPVKVIDLQLVPAPFRIDINLDVASASARVTDYSCFADGNKSLTVPAETAAGKVRIGKMGTSPSDAAIRVFSSSADPIVEPIPLLDIGTLTGKKECLTPLICSYSWKKGTGWVTDKKKADRDAFAGGGLGLMTDTPLLSSTETFRYAALPAEGLPDLNKEPAYKSLSSANLINSLKNTLAGVQIFAYKPDTDGGLGGLLTVVTDVLNGVIGLLQQAIKSLLAPLLDPIVNVLLQGLGIDLAKTDVGARLTCNEGVDLVY